jgi:AAHS family benzoate transporter-like MFS transporter
VFFAALAPVLLIPFIMKTMPFLIKKNRDAELRRIVRKFAPNYPLQENEQFMVPAEDRATSAPVAKLFHDGRGFSTVMIWIAFFMGLFMVYALSSWLTKLMAMAGYSLGSGRLNIRVKTGHKGSKKLGVQKGCRRIVKKCLFSQELATYLLASEKVNLLGQHPASAQLWLVTNYYTYPEPTPATPEPSS